MDAATKKAFLLRARDAAQTAGHVWPEYAACEAAEESAFGESELCREADNLFGQKQGRFTAGLPTVKLPTEEYARGAWSRVLVSWPRFPDWTACCRSRMAVLKGLAYAFPHYAAALAAADGESYVREVSATWSTDPRRADKVLAIHQMATANGWFAPAEPREQDPAQAGNTQ